VNKTAASVYRLLKMVFTSTLAPHLLSLKFFLPRFLHLSNLLINSAILCHCCRFGNIRLGTFAEWNCRPEARV
jgi:hypothetical protein